MGSSGGGGGLGFRVGKGEGLRAGLLGVLVSAIGATSQWSSLMEYGCPGLPPLLSGNPQSLLPFVPSLDSIFNGKARPFLCVFKPKGYNILNAALSKQTGHHGNVVKNFGELTPPPSLQLTVCQQYAVFVRNTYRVAGLQSYRVAELQKHLNLEFSYSELGDLG